MSKRVNTAAPSSVFSPSKGSSSFSSSPGASWLRGANAQYAEEMYRAWSEDPSSVHKSWQAYFSLLREGVDPNDISVMPPEAGAGAPLLVTGGAQEFEGDLQIAMRDLIRAYQGECSLRSRMWRVKEKKSESYVLPRRE